MKRERRKVTAMMTSTERSIRLHDLTDKLLFPGANKLYAIDLYSVYKIYFVQ